ncbi:MAG: DegV family protein [Clostridia bacterium]|nr:DegV family protein [Clostridia bacterium]
MIKITADSTCDLSRDIIERYNISIIPINIVTENATYADGEEITPIELLAKMESGILCKTSAANSVEYERRFKEYAEQYDAIIHINLGANFSSSFNNASKAAEKFKNVYCIDSKNLSTGSGHVVMKACEMAQGGLNATEIVENIKNDVIPRVDASFVVDNMQYLYRGGRCSGLEFLAAKVLRIKPCIEVRNGKMEVGKKYIGKFEKALREYVKQRLNSGNIDYSRCFITHPNCSREIVDMVKHHVVKYADFKEIIETNAGCTVTAHCAGNTLGILYLKRVNV